MAAGVPPHSKPRSGGKACESRLSSLKPIMSQTGSNCGNFQRASSYLVRYAYRADQPADWASLCPFGT